MLFFSGPTKHRLRVFEIRVLRRIFRPDSKRNEVTGERMEEVAQ
jgi:hypothetical protein